MTNSRNQPRHRRHGDGAGTPRLDRPAEPAGRRVPRRSILYGAGVLAGTIGFGGCGRSSVSSGSGRETGADPDATGSATEPLPKPESFRQAPALDEMDLPPVEERLPENPYVVPHTWIREGNYGGTLTMNTYSSSGAANAASDRQFFYGHSPLRWLNDGRDIGPGLVEEWEADDDASEWTFHFRKGLKWSDGEPWTTESIIWWWEKFILEQKMAQTPPDEARSGTGKLAEFTAVDDTTLTMTFDAPSPLTADRMTAWVNGNIGGNGPIWTMPAHYLKQFHPETGDNVPSDWDSVGGLMESKADWHRNPDCPTLIGYRCKSFDNNKGVVLERNPYYWAVMPNGDQLPYLDEIRFNVVTDIEAGKLQVHQGSVDFTMGSFNQISLNDVQGLRDSAEKAGTEVLLWGSGSGTGSVFFFNYDYIDDDIRDLIREPKFRQAISHAFNRDAVQKSVYFNTGEQTTGTLSPKAVEFQVNDEGDKIYQDWRDSYLEYDPDLAKQILDELGVTDTDGDGIRELPNGKKLELRLDYAADQSEEHTSKDNQLVSDLEAIGLKMTRNPIPPQAFDDQWKTGKLMGHTNWDVGDGTSHLINPQWLVPIEYSRWAPLQGQWYQQLGTGTNDTETGADPWERHPPRMQPEQGGPIAQLWKLYDQSKVEPDEMARTQLVWDMIKIHISDGPFFMGCVADYPHVIVVKTELRNVPRAENLELGGCSGPWIHPTPAVYDPECFYWEHPDQHS